MFDWNDLRFFLELQRSDRLLTAAKRLNTTHSTVARHIESIEQSLGTALFVQHAQGYELTPSGQALLKHAEAMENVALLAQEEITQAITPLGKIRLGVTEHRHHVLHPAHECAVRPLPRPGSGAGGSAALRQHPQPRGGDQHPPGAAQRRPADHPQTHRLSPGPVRQPGLPGSRAPLRNREDLARHSWIGYVDDLLFSQELLFLNSFCRAPNVVFRSTSVIAQQTAARAGLGIAVLPNYMARHDSTLVRVLPGETIQRSYWICTRRELHKSVRLRVVWDYLLALCAAEQSELLAQ